MLTTCLPQIRKHTYTATAGQVPAHTHQTSHPSQTLSFTYSYFTHIHIYRMECWISLVGWISQTYIRSTPYLIFNFHIWCRPQGIPPSPTRPNTPVLQIYTPSSSFKYLIHFPLNTRISLSSYLIGIECWLTKLLIAVTWHSLRWYCMWANLTEIFIWAKLSSCSSET